MAPDGVYLTGWKSIADRLGVSVRTAQRREAVAGLPIRRIGPQGGGVQARRDELARWRDEWGQWRELPAEARAAALPPRRPVPAARLVTSADGPSGSPASISSIYRLIQASVVGALEVMASPIRAMTTQMRWRRESG